jgi:ADP-ribose pyrophosphatase YjhB (NUDIX family)
MTQASPNFPDCFYRVTVKGMYVRDGKLLLAREIDTHGIEHWVLPGGGLDFGESIESGLQREIHEEMGVDVVNMSKAPLYTWTWRFENTSTEQWFYACVLAYRIELSSLDITVNNECLEIAFFDQDELKSLTGLDRQMTPLAEIFNPDDFTQAM